MNRVVEPEKTSDRPAWQGLLLILAALVIYLVGSRIIIQRDSPCRPAEAGDWTTIGAGGETDSACGVAPRRAIFLLEPIDLNRADAEVLASLKGIGPELAGRIVAYRKQRGGFTKVSDITGVRGVGQRKLAAFAEEVTVGKCLE